MKYVFKKFQNGVIIGIGIMFSVGLIGVTYAAIVSISEVNTTDTLTANLMNNVINNQKDLDARVSGMSIPTGAAMAFNLSACPTGWSLADGTSGNPDLRGTFIRGMKGDENSRDVSRALGDYQVDEFKSHNHDQRRISSAGGFAGGGTYNFTATLPTSDVGGTETRPKNVALLYCIKD